MRLAIVVLCGAVISFFLYHLHGFILEFNSLQVGFSLMKNYLFHFCFLLFAVTVLEVVFAFSPTQIGVSYMGLILVKLGAFILAFKSVFFESEVVDMATRISLVASLIVFISIETVYCGYILKKVDD